MDLGLVVVLLVAFVLDAADGQLARLRGGGNPAGEWFDHVVDAAKCGSVHLAVLISVYRFFHVQHDVVLLLPIVFTVEASVFYFTIMLTEQLRRQSQGRNARSMPDAHEAAPLLRSFVVLPADYGVLVLSFLLLQSHRAFLVVYAVLLAVNLFFLAASLPKWFREMSQLTR